MGTTIDPTVPVAQPEAEPWPVDDHTIRVDEMFARQLDTEFSAGVRGLLHDSETGVSAQHGEAALEAIAGATPVLNELKERTLSQAIGPRQRSILEPLIETRLDWAAGTLGRLAQRATVEVDDASVAVGNRPRPTPRPVTDSPISTPVRSRLRSARKISTAPRLSTTTPAWSSSPSARP